MIVVKKIPPKDRNPLAQLYFAFPMLVWMGIIFLFSTRAGSVDQTYYLAKKALSLFDPGEALSASPAALAKVNFLVRKMAHVTEYFLLTLFCVRALKRRSKNLLILLFLSAVIAVIYAVSDEFHQSFVAGRTSSLHDVVIDSYGVLLAFLLTVWLQAVHSLDRRITGKTPQKEIH